VRSHSKEEAKTGRILREKERIWEVQLVQLLQTG
jgi:hypothetical protein